MPQDSALLQEQIDGTICDRLPMPAAYFNLMSALNYAATEMEALGVVAMGGEALPIWLSLPCSH